MLQSLTCPLCRSKLALDWSELEAEEEAEAGPDADASFSAFLADWQIKLAELE